jgi:hypothetical protein
LSGEHRGFGVVHKLNQSDRVTARRFVAEAPAISQTIHAVQQRSPDQPQMLGHSPFFDLAKFSEPFRRTGTKAKQHAPLFRLQEGLFVSIHFCVLKGRAFVDTLV